MNFSSSKMWATKTSREIAWTSHDFNNRKKIVSIPRNNVEELDLLGIPGLKQLKDKNRCFASKVIWCSVVVCCFSICAYQVSDRVIHFASNPISTTTIIKKNNSVKFPSFIICPELRVLQTLFTFQRNISNKDCPVSWVDIMKNYSLTINDLMTYFTTENLLESIKLLQPFYSKVSFNLTVEDLDSILGTCKRVTIPDLIPFKKESNKVEIISYKIYNKCQHNDVPPLHVAIRSEDEPFESNYLPLLEVEDHFRLIYTITARQFKFLNTVENPCGDIAVVQACQSDCLDTHTANITGCKLRGQMHRNLPNCSTFGDFAHATLMTLFAPMMINYRADCNCPRPCEEVAYTVTFKNKKINPKPGIEVYFEDNAIDVVTERYAYSIIQLFCDVGGNLGLFLGLCIPTMLEIFVNGIIYLKRNLFHNL